LQLPFGNGELREAAVETNQELRKVPNDRFFQSFASGEMDGNFAVVNAPLFRMTSFTGHS